MKQTNDPALVKLMTKRQQLAKEIANLQNKLAGLDMAIEIYKRGAGSVNPPADSVHS